MGRGVLIPCINLLTFSFWVGLCVCGMGLLGRSFEQILQYFLGPWFFWWMDCYTESVKYSIQMHIHYCGSFMLLLFNFICDVTHVCYSWIWRAFISILLFLSHYVLFLYSISFYLDQSFQIQLTPPHDFLTSYTYSVLDFWNLQVLPLLLF